MHDLAAAVLFLNFLCGWLRTKSGHIGAHWTFKRRSVQKNSVFHWNKRLWYVETGCQSERNLGRRHFAFGFKTHHTIEVVEHVYLAFLRHNLSAVTFVAEGHFAKMAGVFSVV